MQNMHCIINIEKHVYIDVWPLRIIKKINAVVCISLNYTYVILALQLPNLEKTFQIY